MGNQVSVEFEEAAQRVGKLQTKLTDEQSLRLYALFKQATAGDNFRTEPTNFADIKAKKKWKAWNDLHGLPPGEAEEKYIALVKELEKS